MKINEKFYVAVDFLKGNHISTESNKDKLTKEIMKYIMKDKFIYRVWEEIGGEVTDVYGLNENVLKKIGIEVHESNNPFNKL